ncbi:MAG: ArsR/SmtB family transcription factor [Oscillospiraceae bacterium]
MDECTKNRQLLANEFKKCQNLIVAIGDETRQSIIITLLENDTIGMRVGEITERTHLSRPAVSHHLKILKDAKIVSMRRKGTKNYYYMDIDKSKWGSLVTLINHINDIIEKASKERYPNNYLGEEE